MPRGREELQEIQGETEGEGLLTDDTTSDETSAGEIESVKGESAKETLERVFKDEGTSEDQDPLSGDAATSDESGEPRTTEDDARPIKQAKKKGGDDDYDPDLQPPQRLDDEGKKLFNNLPKGLKRRFNKALKDVEAMGTRNAKAASEYAQRWGEFEKAMHPFAVKWAKYKQTLQSGILHLAHEQERLTDPDEAKREQAFVELSRRAKVDLVKIAQRLTTGSAGTSQRSDTSGILDISNHPQVIELKSQNSALIKRLDSVESKMQHGELTQHAQPIVDELRAIVDEKDPATGQLLYPAFQDEAFLDSVKPLVSEKVRAARERGENLSYGEAFVQAYHDKMKVLFGASYRPIQSSLHASNGNSRAISAARPLRGRPAPVTGGQNAGDIDIPDDLPRDAKSQLAYIFGR